MTAAMILQFLLIAREAIEALRQYDAEKAAALSARLRAESDKANQDAEKAGM